MVRRAWTVGSSENGSICRRPHGNPLNEPPERRGDGPAAAARYWGLTQHEYCARADVWRIDPKREILVGMMCERVEAVDNLPAILAAVSGTSLVIIGEGDLSQNLGVPGQYDHSSVVAHMRRIVEPCNAHGAFCGPPTSDQGMLKHSLEEDIAASSLPQSSPSKPWSVSAHWHVKLTFCSSRIDPRWLVA